MVGNAISIIFKFPEEKEFRIGKFFNKHVHLFEYKEKIVDHNKNLTKFPKDIPQKRKSHLKNN